MSIKIFSVKKTVNGRDGCEGEQLTVIDLRKWHRKYVLKILEVWGWNSPLNPKILNCKIGTDFAEKHSIMEVTPTHSVFVLHSNDSPTL